MNNPINTLKNFGAGPLTCFYCDRPAADSNSELIATMGKKTNKEDHWETQEVKVPRCASCRSAHATANTITKVMTYVGMGTGLIVARVWGDHYLLMFRDILATGLACLFIGMGVKKAIMSSRNMKASEDTKLYPEVAGLKEQGWMIRRMK